MRLSNNFYLSEFACNDKVNTPVPEKLYPNVKELAKNLQVIRDAIGVPIHINSGYRTVTYNKSVGGGLKSQHLQAKAADLVAVGKTPKQLHALILKLIKEGKIKDGGVGLYDTFVHYDVRDVSARWQI